MVRITKVPIEFRESESGLLTIRPDSLLLMPPIETYNWLIDVTLNKSMHLPNMKARKYIDEKPEVQRNFLRQCYIDLMERFNAFESKDKICTIIIKYEIQPGTLTLHAHANCRIDTKTSDENVQLRIHTILKSLGFNKVGISVQGIKYPKDRNDYLLKIKTAYDTPLVILDV